MGAVVTFLSDFGTKDAYVAQVKAVILSRAPWARIVDITHDVDPFDIVSAGWLLFTSHGFFPEGTVHLAVVDPGVGTDRAVLAVHKGAHTFVGPNNGIFSFLYPADDVLKVAWRPLGPISSTFHGRDVFAPIVARILTEGVHDLPAEPCPEPVRFDTVSPMVVHVDRFGNMVTNIRPEHLGPGKAVVVNGVMVDGLYGTYAEIPQGRLGLVTGSAGTIEIASPLTRASDIVRAGPGHKVLVVSQ